MSARVAFSEHGWGNFTLKAAGANLGHFFAELENGGFGRIREGLGEN